ncbi:MAG: tetratricopeptide repeat protein, partial [Chitinophagales bacterium]
MSRNVNVREAVEQLMQQVKSAQANQADEQAMDYLQQVYKLVSAHQEPNTLLLSVCFQLGQGTRHQSPPTNAQGYFEQVVDYTAVFAHLAISAQKQVIQAYHELCEIYVLQANPEKHAWAAQQSLHLLDHQTIRFAPEEQLSLYLESYYQLGSVAAKKANLAQQYHHLQAALALINQQAEPPTTVGVVKIYNELGSYFTEKSDHEEAMVFFQKSLNICLENGGRAHSLLGTTYNYIGWSNEHRSQIDKALYYYEKGLHARRYLLGENDPSVAQSYSNMAVCFSHKNNLTETLRLYKKALSIFLYTYGKQRIHPDLVRSYRNLGFAYIETEKFEQAVHYLNLALTQNKAIYGNKHSEVCVVLCHLGNCYTRMEHYEQAAQHYHLAMNAIFHQFNDTSLYATPSIAQFPISERLSLYAIMNKAGVLQKSQQPKFQDLVQKTYTFGLALMDEMRKSISTEGAQVILSKRFFNLYEGAIKACYQRFLASDPPHEEQASLYLNRAFTFTEKSKATALLAALRAEDAKITATIPENYLQEERRLSQAITDVEKNIALALVKNNIETDVQVRAWQNEHFQLKQTHKDLVKELEQAFPEYHFLKYNTQVADVLQVQTQLNADTGLIAYFVGLHSLFVFYVDKQQQHLQAINYEGNLATKVTEMQQAISWMDLDLFAETAHHLYQTLLNPIASFFASKKHLLFIADDYLNYLPFDTLLPSYDATKHTDFFELDY